MAALVGMANFVVGLGVGAFAGVLGAPMLWRWVGWHAWKAADREARLDQTTPGDDFADWGLLFEGDRAEEGKPSS